MARYRLCDLIPGPVAGVGQTVNLSSSGMLLRLQHDLHVGERIEIAVDLPLTGNTAPVELTAQGHVVRVEPGCVAIQFERQDLKRTPPEALASPPPCADLRR